MGPLFQAAIPPWPDVDALQAVVGDVDRGNGEGGGKELGDVEAQIEMRGGEDVVGNGDGGDEEGSNIEAGVEKARGEDVVSSKDRGDEVETAPKKKQQVARKKRKKKILAKPKVSLRLYILGAL